LRCLQARHARSDLGHVVQKRPDSLLIQDVLADGLVELTDEDRRGITPLFWSHISPYGEVTVDMTRRISLLADTGTTGDGDSGSAGKGR
jgi:hypothetical protein